MKKVVIGITGSIAIYKTCEIISRLKKKNYDIELNCEINDFAIRQI